MVKRAAGKLLYNVTPGHDFHTWPPEVYVHNQLDENGQPVLNAFAHACGGDIDEGLPVQCGDNEEAPIPHVHITKRILEDLIQGREDRLAFVMGHEIAHITLGHTTKFAHQWRATSEVSLYAFGRQQEIGADVEGAKYALAAGYDYETMLNAIYRFIELDMSYSSFEGLGVNHPSWEDRLVFINEQQADLWRAMSTFRTGVSFLAAEQYALAEPLFRKVVQAFPNSYEAHANLGYALLMQYADALESADVEQLGIGHIVVGAFTRRPKSLEPPVRGMNRVLWFQAVSQLNEALRLKPDMAEAKANLGIAYLLNPSGPEAARAGQLLDEAARLALADRGMDPRTKAAILINAGVADLAAGLLQECQEQLVGAETQINAFANGFRAQTDLNIHNELVNALRYNAGLLFETRPATQSKQAALDFFYQYLKSTSPTSAWWPLAYRRYQSLGNQLGTSVASASSLSESGSRRYRILGGVKLEGGGVISLGQSTDEMLETMNSDAGGRALMLSSNLIEDTNLNEYDFLFRGMRVLATQEVLAIVLASDGAAVDVKESGLGADAKKVVVGMSAAMLNATLGTDYERRVLVDPDKGYRFYRDLGLAVHVEDGSVRELVITQVPIVQAIEPSVD
jgi:tetratricopeptide (TPR) repeat protein